MNERLLDAINYFAGDSSPLDAAAKFMANDGIYLLGVVVVILGLLELRRDFRRSVFIGVAAVAAVVLALGFASAGGHLIVERRPFIADHDTIQLIAHSADNAFPSDHATVAAAAAGVAFLAWRRAGLIAVAIALLIGLARVFVGVHYPGDVAAGWLAGFVAAGIAWTVVTVVAGRTGLIRSPETAPAVPNAGG